MWFLGGWLDGGRGGNSRRGEGVGRRGGNSGGWVAVLGRTRAGNGFGRVV